MINEVMSQSLQALLQALHLMKRVIGSSEARICFMSSQKALSWWQYRHSSHASLLIAFFIES